MYNSGKLKFLVAPYCLQSDPKLFRKDLCDLASAHLLDLIAHYNTSSHTTYNL